MSAAVAFACAGLLGTLVLFRMPFSLQWLAVPVALLSFVTVYNLMQTRRPRHE
jgi:hypothetical protein